MKSPFSNVYGVARTLLACNTLISLLSSDAIASFRPAQLSTADSGYKIAAADYGLFALLNGREALARWVAIALLVVVASGYRPRWTGVLHWWVSASFFASMVTQDGGDQCAAVLTLMLIPLTLCDPRVWHWSASPAIESRSADVLQRIGRSTLFATRFQIAGLYLHAAVGKVAIREWTNGTAIYYWLLDTRVGVATVYHDWVLALLRPAWVSAALTWGPMALEFALFLALAMAPGHRARKLLFWLGLLFHVGNAVFFGLVSFMIAMTAALVLLLRPAEEPYVLPAWLARTALWLRHWRRPVLLSADLPQPEIASR